ncbi:MAG: serine protease [Anaerolineae bacterium]|nr:serine protease [Anaerolineae bacterium]MDW8101404.1 serine protease [Anaerolineae bacterium]
MHKWILRVILLALLALAGFQPPAFLEKPLPASYFLQLVGDPEVRMVQRAVFMVKVKHREGERNGTGVAVGKGLMLTAFHLVGNLRTGKITAEEIWLSQPHTEWKEEIPAEIVKADPSLDLVVLKFEAPIELPSISPGDPVRLRPGEVIYVIGHEFFPGGIGVLYPRDGEILDELREESAFFAIFPPVARGFSGGGVFNQKHELVGIVSRNFIFFQTFREGGRFYKTTKRGALVIKVDRALRLLE